MSVQVLAGVFSDAVGNVNLASSNVTATVDTVVPTVSGVSSVIADGSYRAGTTIDVTVSFTENVVVTTAVGTPTVLMETGATDRLASYVSGSGTSVITFRYVVQTGDISSDLDVQSSSALALNGGFIRDASGNDAVRTLASPGASGSLGLVKAIVIDTIAPSAPSSLAVTPIGGTVVANTLLANNTNMTATATIVAGQATGGWAELILGSTTIATDVSIASGETSVTFNLGFSAAADLQAAIAAVTVPFTLFSKPKLSAASAVVPDVLPGVLTKKPLYVPPNFLRGTLTPEAIVERAHRNGVEILDGSTRGKSKSSGCACSASGAGLDPSWLLT
jgi:hypothetical protein